MQGGEKTRGVGACAAQRRFVSCCLPATDRRSNPLPLYPHQVEGARWLADRTAALLADEPGLGKTITALVATKSLQPQDVGCPRVLVLCPTVVLYNWEAEAETWLEAPCIQVVAHGKTTIEPVAEVVIVTHGLLLNAWIRSQLLSASWDVVIVDEAHGFKSMEAERTTVLYHAQAGVVKAAGRVWLLSGTPCPNNAAELYTHLRGLDWKRLVPETGGKPMEYDEYVRRYCVWEYGLHGIKITANQRARLPELKKRLEGFILRRKKKDELKNLPPIRFETVHLRPVNLDAALVALGQDLSKSVRKELADLERGEDAALTFFDTIKNRTEFAEFRRLCGMAKAQQVVELLERELEDGALDKVVVFAHHRAVVDLIAAGLERFGIRTITGASSPVERNRAVASFQTDARVRVMVSNIVAGGVGVTLTAASDVVFAEQSWVPGENAQAANRCHRIGQTERVRVRFTALAGTLDATITQALRRKAQMIQEVLET